MIVIATLVLLILRVIYVDQAPMPSRAGFSKLISSEKTNITLTMSGRCQNPLTYVGVDNRAHVLLDYDIIGTPTEKYSPPLMNWGRVLLIDQAIQQCKGVSKWIIYSDTDAYFVSRSYLLSKLRKIPATRHLVLHLGFWNVNSGFLAWRTSNSARRLLQKWEELYVRGSPYLAEQRSLLTVYTRNPDSVVQRGNGYLGWHLKGGSRYKAKIATIGRRYTERTGPAILESCIALSIILSSCVLSSRFLPPTHKLRPAVHRFVRFFHAITSTSLIVSFFIMVAIGSAVLWTDGKVKPLLSCNAMNYTHLLPNGRIMVTPQYWINNMCRMQGPGPRTTLFNKIGSCEKCTLAMFTIGEIIEWSALLKIYPLLVLLRILLSKPARTKPKEKGQDNADISQTAIDVTGSTSAELLKKPDERRWWGGVSKLWKSKQ